MILSFRIWVGVGLLALGLSVGASAEEGGSHQAAGEGGGAGKAGSPRSEERSLAERHLVKLAALRTQYLQALLRLEEKYTRASEIDLALKVRAERVRFRHGNEAPDWKRMRLERLRGLGSIYSQESERMRGEFEADMAAFRKRRGEAFVSRDREGSGDSS